MLSRDGYPFKEAWASFHASLILLGCQLSPSQLQVDQRRQLHLCFVLSERCSFGEEVQCLTLLMAALGRAQQEVTRDGALLTAQLGWQSIREGRHSIWGQVLHLMNSARLTIMITPSCCSLRRSRQSFGATRC